MERYLTQREAERCENALEPVCKCRCQGAKHGAGRVKAGGDFSELPLRDPHHRPPLTKGQALKLLRSISRHVVMGDCCSTGLHEIDGFDVWRATQDTLNTAYTSAKGPPMRKPPTDEELLERCDG